MDDKKNKAKIKTAEEIAEAIGLPPRRQKVIMCHGTFDVVHPGHIRHLMYASSKADFLIASVTADEFIEKANFRPYVPQDLRALNLAALDMVDCVIIDKNPIPLENLAKIKGEHILCTYDLKGSTYDRKVLKDSKLSQTKFLNTFESKEILKDLDFKLKEKSMKISEK